MTAGRPHNSNTPLWRCKAAINVRLYRYVHTKDGSQSACAREFGMSRTTVIKYWDAAEWTAENEAVYNRVRKWHWSHLDNLDYHQCADELGMTYDEVMYHITVFKNLWGKYIY